MVTSGPKNKKQNKKNPKRTKQNEKQAKEQDGFIMGLQKPMSDIIDATSIF